MLKTGHTFFKVKKQDSTPHLQTSLQIPDKILYLFGRDLFSFYSYVDLVMLQWFRSVYLQRRVLEDYCFFGFA